MDLPLEALKMIAQAVPVEGEASHNLRWTPENGFILGILWGGQWYDVRFDFDDKLEDIKKEITALTGIPMPEQEKKETKKEGPPMDKEASKTPLLDGIKEAVLGGSTGSLSSRHNAQQEALNSALGTGRTTTTPTRTARPGLLTRLKDFHQRVTESQ